MAIAIARYVLPVPAGPMAKRISFLRLASAYSFGAKLRGVMGLFLTVLKIIVEKYL